MRNTADDPAPEFGGGAGAWWTANRMLLDCSGTATPTGPAVQLRWLGDPTDSDNHRQEPQAGVDRSHVGCKRAAVVRCLFAAGRPAGALPSARRIFASSHIEITRGDHLVPDRASHPNAVPAHRSGRRRLGRRTTIAEHRRRVLDSDAGIGHRLPRRRGLQALHLRPVDRLLPQAGRGQQPGPSDHGRQDGVRKDVDGGPHFFAGEPRASRQDPRDEHEARAPGRAHRRPGARPRARRDARSSTSAAACTRRRSPGRSTRRRSPTSCCRARTSRR